MKVYTMLESIEARLRYFEHEFEKKRFVTQDVGSLNMLGDWLIDFTQCLNTSEQAKYWDKCNELFVRIKNMEGFDQGTKLEDFIE